MTIEAITRDENVEWGRARFFDALQRVEPRSVLDVGCGRGDLLRRCREAGIEAFGLEPDDASLGDPVEPGLRRGCADATRLPLADASVDWVTMRFVPHHLADPAAAFAEALRVARVGFVVAEPWFDDDEPTQRAARAVDVWVKRQHNKRGMVHEPVLDRAALVAALPSEHRANVETRIEHRLRMRTAEDVEAELSNLESELAPNDEDHATLASLVQATRRTGVSWNGSLILIVRR